MNGNTRLVYRALGVTALTLTLGSCGGGGGGGGEDRGDAVPAPVDARMEIGVAYAVSANDRLVVTGREAAEIRVRHSLSPDQRTVTLVSGRAELLQ